jgi:hypothetical protein
MGSDLSICQITQREEFARIAKGGMGFQGDKKYQDDLETACKVKMKDLSPYAH